MKCTWCRSRAAYRPKDVDDDRLACEWHILQLPTEGWEYVLNLKKMGSHDSHVRGGKAGAATKRLRKMMAEEDEEQ